MSDPGQGTPNWADDDRVEDVDAFNFTVPLPSPVRNGTTLIQERDYVIVTIRTRDGITGTSCALARQAPIAATINDFLSSRLVGRSPSAIQLLWSEMYRAGELFLGRSGTFMRALSMIDIALWDMHGKKTRLSIANLLGGSGREIPVLMALGYYHPSGDLVRLQSEYAELSARGFRRFKMMAGGASLAEDVRRIEAISDVLPSDASLAVDVNGAWSSAREALDFINASPIEFDFVEDPFRPDNRTALQQFRERSTVPVAIGEWESGSHRFLQLIESNLLDVLRIDATAVGGITEWQRIAALAAAYDKRIVPHYYPEVHSHLVAATTTAEAVEVVPTITGADNFELLVTSTSWRELPSFVTSDRPGLGVEWDWEAIHHFRAPGLSTWEIESSSGSARMGFGS